MQADLFSTLPQAECHPAGFDDCELLENIIKRTAPDGARAAARRLLKEFGSFGHALAADAARLAETCDARTVAELAIVREATIRVTRHAVVKRHALNHWNAVLEYCRATMAFEPREQFRVLFLDKRNQLIADQIMQRGTVDHVPVYPREILRRALELNATAIILAHNHPSGDPSPSRADIDMTRAIVEACTLFGIAVHDHLIFGTEGHASLKGLGHMK